jgi:hypothetical protein
MTTPVRLTGHRFAGDVLTGARPNDESTVRLSHASAEDDNLLRKHLNRTTGSVRNRASWPVICTILLRY